LVIDDEGNKQGVLKTEAALSLAKEKSLDLVLVAPDGKPPVAKILDYGHYKYEKDKKQKESKKSGRTSNIKKVLKFSLKIGTHDYNVRRKRGEDFLKKGYKVQGSVIFRGREMAHRDLGDIMIERFIKDMEEFGVVESKSSGPRDVSVFLAPIKKGEKK